MDRKAKAVWQGSIFDGKGTLSTESGALKDTPYSFKTRFEGEAGTNPEELLASAHAGCFTMALSGELAKAGIKADKLETDCTVTIEKTGDGFTITKSYLNVVATIPGVDKAKFDAAVKAAEVGCPVSKLFKTDVKVTSKLV